MNAASLVGTLLTALFIVTITGFFYGWWIAIRQLLRGNPVLRYRERPVPPWAALDIAVAYFLSAACAVSAIYLVCQIYDMPLEQKMSERPPAALVAIVAAGGGASFLGTTLAVIFVALRTGCTLADLGIDARSLGADVKLGLIGFAMIAPPVFALQGFLAMFFEPHHPLIDMLQDDANAAMKWSMLGSVALSAVVVAPFAEEVLFRLLLQGFFERIAAARFSIGELLFGLSEDGKEKPETQPQRPISTTPAYAVIFISAFIFAAMHYSHGPAPIPLFFFALGLGYLYHKTHRLLPSIIVHAMLNLTTVLMLWQSLLQDTAAG